MDIKIKNKIENFYNFFSKNLSPEKNLVIQNGNKNIINSLVNTRYNILKSNYSVKDISLYKGYVTSYMNDIFLDIDENIVVTDIGFREKIDPIFVTICLSKSKVEIEENILKSLVSNSKNIIKNYELIKNDKQKKTLIIQFSLNSSNLIEYFLPTKIDDDFFFLDKSYEKEVSALQEKLKEIKQVLNSEEKNKDKIEIQITEDSNNNNEEMNENNNILKRKRDEIPNQNLKEEIDEFDTVKIKIFQYEKKK